MQRLRDQDSFSEPGFERLADLVRNEAPLASLAERPPRIALDAPKIAPAKSRILRVAGAGLLVVGGAILWFGLRSHHSESPSTESQVNAPPSGLTQPIGSLPVFEHSANEATSATSPQVAAASSNVANSEAKGARSIHSKAKKSTAPTTGATRTPLDSEGASSASYEATMVAEAAKTLRYLHNPGRALVLLDAYLENYPNGILVEEAMALGIEAAVQRDAHEAAKWGALYLSRFPNGRFAENAKKAVAP